MRQWLKILRYKQRRITVLITLCCCLGLLGCVSSWRSEPPVWDISQVNWPQEATQVLAMTTQGESKSLLVALSYQDAELTLEFLSASGMRLATLAASTSAVEFEKHVPVVLDIDAQRILRDMLLVYAAADVLAQMSRVQTVADEGPLREVLVDDERLRIEYGDRDQRWQTPIRFNNLSLQYAITIKTLRVDHAEK